MPRLQTINTKTMMIEMDHPLAEGAAASVHGQMCRMRRTAAGTYLVGLSTKGGHRVR
jgi:hypothetical protein